MKKGAKSFTSSHGFSFTLARKRIKNVNLRVREDGSVAVSAPYGTSEDFIISFVEKNGVRIKSAIEKMSARRASDQKKKYTRAEEEAFLLEATRACREIEPLFFSGEYIPPRISVCRGKSRYGYCMPSGNEIRLNVCLTEYGRECLRYVAMHEYCHFLVPNHSDAFYRELSMRLPEWREIKKLLKEKKS